MRDERAETAVELTILAVPFFVILGAILETSVVFLASQVLDSAVQDASRLILTGQAQSAGYHIADFRTQVCNRLFNLFNCDNLQIDVETLSTFTVTNLSASPLDPTDPKKWVLTQNFFPGTGSDIEIVRVYYKWPIILNFGGFNLATSSDGTHLLGSARVFENEPFT